MSIQQLKVKAREHWTTWLPEKVAELKAEGTLNEATHGAAVRAQERIEELLQQGYRHHEAEEVALAEFILLKPEPAAVEPEWLAKESAQREAAYRKNQQE